MLEESLEKQHQQTSGNQAEAEHSDTAAANDEGLERSGNGLGKLLAVVRWMQAVVSDQLQGDPYRKSTEQTTGEAAAEIAQGTFVLGFSHVAPQ